MKNSVNQTTYFRGLKVTDQKYRLYNVYNDYNHSLENIHLIINYLCIKKFKDDHPLIHDELKIGMKWDDTHFNTDIHCWYGGIGGIIFCI